MAPSTSKLATGPVGQDDTHVRERVLCWQQSFFVAVTWRALPQLKLVASPQHPLRRITAMELVAAGGDAAGDEDLLLDNAEHDGPGSLCSLRPSPPSLGDKEMVAWYL